MKAFNLVQHNTLRRVTQQLTAARMALMISSKINQVEQRSPRLCFSVLWVTVQWLQAEIHRASVARRDWTARGVTWRRSWWEQPVDRRFHPSWGVCRLWQPTSKFAAHFGDVKLAAMNDGGSSLTRYEHSGDNTRAFYVVAPMVFKLISTKSFATNTLQNCIST